MHNVGLDLDVNKVDNFLISKKLIHKKLNFWNAIYLPLASWVVIVNSSMLTTTL